ncbi:hypothetical protein ACJMK2_040673 [Sinanodonta woodiana]|uniref:Arrestin C-terminal-like domain-containing protein n=1 Tax=Sinanodonta woodiana TaxID=1069815 RepID=A0ABD3W1R3_SINWO
MMDYVQRFEIELDKEVYYAGEMLKGRVCADVTENTKVKGIRLALRGKAHTEWKINKAGERRTVKDDEYFIDEKKVVWGKDKNDEGGIPILPRGKHVYPFKFKLPESSLPCSFESKVGSIRYYLRVIMDIPYASPPQSMKYFTLIGPHIDCMEDKYLTPVILRDKTSKYCLCCAAGPLLLKATMERTAYCCGENLRFKAEISNGTDQEVWLLCTLVQEVEFYINKGVLGLAKTVTHKVWEYQAEMVEPYDAVSYNRLHEVLRVPPMPPTLLEVCNIIQIYYTLKVKVASQQAGGLLELNFPVTVATVPFRIPNSTDPEIHYEVAVQNVEGGNYISPEFQLGQVYMGDDSNIHDDVILFRPQYVCLSHETIEVTNARKAWIELTNDVQQKPSTSDNPSYCNSIMDEFSTNHSSCSFECCRSDRDKKCQGSTNILLTKSGSHNGIVHRSEKNMVLKSKSIPETFHDVKCSIHSSARENEFKNYESGKQNEVTEKVREPDSQTECKDSTNIITLPDPDEKQPSFLFEDSDTKHAPVTSMPESDLPVTPARTETMMENTHDERLIKTKSIDFFQTHNSKISQVTSNEEVDTVAKEEEVAEEEEEKNNQSHYNISVK